MVTPHPLRRGLLVAAGLLAASTATAQIYKWTDEKGGVHYSSTPPAQATATRPVSVDGRVTVYTPESATPRASETDDLRLRILNLEEQIYSERRRPVQVASEGRSQRDREECERQRRVDCDRPEVIDDGPRQVIIVPSRRQQQPNLAPPPTPKPVDPPVGRVKPEALEKARSPSVAK